MSLGPHDGWLLRLWGVHVTQAFGHIPYHVGSSLAGKVDHLGQKVKFRDVDVRLMLPDDEYVAFFGNPYTPGHDGPRLNVWNFAWSQFGKQFTRLPIDFQFQHTTLANDEFDEPRSGLVVSSSEIPVVINSRAGRNPGE